MKRIAIWAIGLAILGLVALGSGYWVGTNSKIDGDMPAPITSFAPTQGTEANPETSNPATDAAVTSRVDIGPLGTDEVRVIHRETIRWNPRDEKK
jgi:hypothetical protein